MLKLQMKIYIFYINIKCKYLDIALLKKNLLIQYIINHITIILL